MSAPGTGISAQGSPFWRFSLGFYRMPGVADACIAVQEESGVDVNVLLFLLWSATLGRRFTVAEIAELDAKAGAWREMTVIPLRAVRRALKAPPALVAPQAAEAFRNKIKSVELESERLQQEAMYELAQKGLAGSAAPQSAETARANVAAYEKQCVKPLSKTALAALLDAFVAFQARAEQGDAARPSTKSA